MKTEQNVPRREVSTVGECVVDDRGGKPDRMKPRGEAG